MQNSDHTILQWVIAALGTIGAAALAAMLKVWLENKRMERDDFRKTLVERIQDLEMQLALMHDENANLREEIGSLKSEVRTLRSKDTRGDDPEPSRS